MTEQIAQRADEAQLAPITPDDLIGYLNTVTSGTKKGTFYNLPEEQRAALMDNIAKMVAVHRPFAALNVLSPSVTDDARIATALQLLSTKPTLPAEFCDAESLRKVRKWEGHILRDVLDKMPPTRVFDLFHYLIGFRHEKNGNGKTVFRKSAKKVGGKILRGIAKDWLIANAHKLDLWSVKYTKDFRILAQDLHLADSDMPAVRFLFRDEANTPLQRKVQKVRDASKDEEPPQELWKLPYENARGFALNKFGMSTEDFEKEFSEHGKKTVKEQRTSHKRTVKAGGTSEFNPERARLFDLYVFLGGQDSIPAEAREWIERAAEREAKRIGMDMANCAVIVDTSLSMCGTKDAPRHPLFRAMTIAKIASKSTEKFKLFFTTEQQEDVIVPKLAGSTTYAPSVVKALKEGFTQIFLVGDGYENAPEGLTHRVLYAFKKKIDLENKVTFIHLNPVQAAESNTGVREMSPYAPSAGIRQVEGISSAIFTALAKVYPMKALEAYYDELVKLQGPRTKALMPSFIKRLPAPEST